MKKQKKKIGILLFTREDTDEYKRALRFKEEIVKADYEPEIFQSDLFSVFFRQNKLEIFYNTKKFELDDYKLMFPRYCLCNGDAYHRYSIAGFLEVAGMRLVNRPTPANMAKNKRDSLLKLALAGLLIIPTGINYSQFFFR